MDVEFSIENDRPYLLVLLLQGELLLLHLFQLVTEIKFGGLLLQLGELILVLGYLLQGRFHAGSRKKNAMKRGAPGSRGYLDEISANRQFRIGDSRRKLIAICNAKKEGGILTIYLGDR